jgi:hypothetical protein
MRKWMTLRILFSFSFMTTAVAFDYTLPQLQEDLSKGDNEKPFTITASAPWTSDPESVSRLKSKDVEVVAFKAKENDVGSFFSKKDQDTRHFIYEINAKTKKLQRWTRVQHGKGPYTSHATVKVENGKVQAYTECLVNQPFPQRGWCRTATPALCQRLLESTKSKDFDQVHDKIESCKDLDRMIGLEASEDTLAAKRQFEKLGITVTEGAGDSVKLYDLEWLTNTCGGRSSLYRRFPELNRSASEEKPGH